VSLPPVTAPYLASVLLLGTAGVAKLLRPVDTANALRAAGLPSGRTLVRVGALGEVAVAVAALVVPGRLTGAMVAAAYSGFAVFVAVALRHGWVLASCGCFGRPDTRATVAHAALNAGAAASALWWALAWPGGGGSSRLGRLFVQQSWHGAALTLIILVVVGLAYLVWTDPRPAARL
jgi:hypothetical protein